jgi:hypothetical protein
VLIPTLTIRWLDVSLVTELIQVGLLWVVLTAVFEICLGRFVLHYSWNQIAADYDVLHGGLMPFGFVLLALSPLIAARLRGIFSGSNSSI